MLLSIGYYLYTILILVNDCVYITNETTCLFVNIRYNRLKCNYDCELVTTHNHNLPINSIVLVLITSTYTALNGLSLSVCHRYMYLHDTQFLHNSLDVRRRTIMLQMTFKL